MNKLSALSFKLASVLALTVVAQPSAWAARFVNVQSIPAPTSATELVYSPAYRKLIVKNSASAVFVIDLVSKASTGHYAVSNFTDMSMSPSGRYVFVADYGGENIGYGTPASPSYVHRLDLSNSTWGIESAYIAGNIQAASDTNFFLKSMDQWVTFYYDLWSGGSAVVQLNSPTGSFQGYYPGVYAGDFRYSATSGRLMHGNSGLSSQEIHAFTTVKNEFVAQEQSGMYGSAQGYGGSLALATDGSVLYYGKLAVDALDVSHNLRVYPENIYAATGTVAFGNGHYYDTKTGVQMGALPFNTTVYALNPDGSEFWTYDASANMLRRYVQTR